MIPPVKLSKILEGLEMQSDESKTLLDKKTGEIVIVADDEFDAAERELDAEEAQEAASGEETAAEAESDEEEEPGGGPDWFRLAVRRAREVVEDEEGVRFVELPTKHDIHEWSIMERFCRSVEDPRIADELGRAIHGRGAFRVFKDTLYRHKIEKQWFAFREKAFREIAIEWCDDNEIPYVED